MSAGALVVWRLVDGKPGHEKQSAGLLQAIAAKRPVARYDFDVRAKARLWGQLRGQSGQDSADVPPPALIVGAGHGTHLPMLLVRAARGGVCVALMKPSLPHRLFDLIFVPQHDRCRARANVVVTRGVICATSDADKEPRRGLILLGGTSPHFAWERAEVAKTVAAIAAASPEVSWEVCDSRRTPPGMLDSVPSLPNIRRRPRQATSSDFLHRALAQADAVWVTADSASMLYEALSAKARVGVIELPPKRRRESKHARGIRQLQAQGHVHSTADGFRLAATPAGPFAPENARCAAIVLDRLERPAPPRTPRRLRWPAATALAANGSGTAGLAGRVGKRAGRARAGLGGGS